MICKAWVLVCVAATAWGQTDGGAAPPPAAVNAPQPFQQTAPPEWNAAGNRVVDSAGPKDPQTEKVKQIGAEMDRAENPASAPPAPSLPAQDKSLFQNSLRTIVSLCLVLAIIFVLAYLAKRFGRNTALLAGSNLGRVLGKIYLEPRASLHFVRTGNRVLVVGVTQNALSLVTEFDAAAFDAAARALSREPTAAGGADAFLNQLQSNIQDMAGSGAASGEDAEVAALRQDLQRLQRYLQEGAHESKTP